MISEFPLFLFTTLGGLAAGAYVAAAIFPDVDRKPKRPWLFPLVCLALLGVGLLGVLGHLGRPERFLLAMSNPSSMIAEEAYWSIAFGALMLVDFVLLLRRRQPARCARRGRRAAAPSCVSWDGCTSRATATPPGLRGRRCRCSCWAILPWAPRCGL
ncbi:MAG: DmsC/YnfH family molybdoenzyme membrane anchor subunit [Eggerthellaceae bacterium]